MKFYVAIFALALIFVSGCQKEELTPVSPQTTILAKHSVPFNATMDGLAIISMPPTGECGSQMPRTVIDGEGVGTHIGSFTTHAVGCIIPDPQITGKGTFINGTQTLTAANGDKLFGSWYGDYETDLTTGIVTYNLFFTFVDGTGRFTGIEGELEFGATAPYGGPGEPKAVHAEGGGTVIYSNVKPFSGKMVGESDVSTTYSCGPGMQPRDIELAGHSSLGEVSSVHQHCNGLTSPNGGIIKSGVATLYTPDGNMFVEYEGSFTFDQPYPNCTVSYINTLTGVITGGTGIYAGASGSIDGVGVQDLTCTPTPVELTFRGFLIK